jgi:hypothetical protein
MSERHVNDMQGADRRHSTFWLGHIRVSIDISLSYSQPCPVGIRQELRFNGQARRRNAVKRGLDQLQSVLINLCQMPTPQDSTEPSISCPSGLKGWRSLQLSYRSEIGLESNQCLQVLRLHYLVLSGHFPPDSNRPSAVHAPSGKWPPLPSYIPSEWPLTAAVLSRPSPVLFPRAVAVARAFDPVQTR